MNVYGRGTKSVFFVLLFTAVVFFNTALADEVVLENGDRLTGTVTFMEKGTLTLETGYSEPIKIQTSKIKRLKTENPVEVHLESGEILKGELNTDEKGDVVIGGTEERGTAVFGLDRIMAVNPPPVEPPRWKGSVLAGASTQTGNSENTNITFGADAARRTERDRYNLRFLYNYSKEDEEVTARSYYGAGKYDYFFTEKFYGYLSVELLKDTFKDLNLRTIVGPGVGYQVWEDDIRFLAVEAGVAYFSEDLKKDGDRDWITARLAADLSYRIGKAVIFTNQFVIWPSLENGKDYKLRNEAALNSPLGAGWSLRIANILEHDGNPPEDIKRNDWYWILGLQYAF